MLDVGLLAKAMLVGGLAAGAVMGLLSWGAPRPWRHSARWSWAVGAGILAASGATDQWPAWPALEDRARFLTVLVPLIVAVETLVASLRPAGAAWIARCGLAAAAAPIVLYNSVYVADLSGPGSALWSPLQAAVIFSGLAATLALAWALLSRLQARTSTSAVQWLLFVDALASALTVMLSGYFRAGLLGLGLAGSIAGAALASHATPARAPGGGSLGMSVIGVFAVVLMGRFFGSLATSLAAGLLAAPLLACCVEGPRLGRLSAGWRAAARLACVAVPLVVVVIVAQRRFAAASSAPARTAESRAAAVPIEK